MNTIINEQGIWPLELTCRFGYPGFAVLDALQADDWAALFRALLDHSTRFATLPGYAVGVVLTVPPFPYRYGYAEMSRGLPISLDPSLSREQRDQLHFGEVDIDSDGRLITSGSTGYLMVATGVGSTVAIAQQHAYALSDGVHVPNLRFRNDIGMEFRMRSHARLRALGHLGA